MVPAVKQDEVANNLYVIILFSPVGKCQGESWTSGGRRTVSYGGCWHSNSPQEYREDSDFIMEIDPLAELMWVSWMFLWILCRVHWTWNKLYFNLTSFILHCCLSAWRLLTYLLSGSTQAACNFTRTQFLDRKNLYCSIQLVFGHQVLYMLTPKEIAIGSLNLCCYT